VSTEDQGRGFSITTQVEACQKLAEHEGYAVPKTHILIDEGTSGTTMDRPGLRRLRELVQIQAIAAGIVYDPGGILMQKLQQCEKDLKRWQAAYLGEAIDLEDFKGKTAEIIIRRKSIEQELTRVDEQQRVLERAHIETTSLQEYCARLRQNLPGFDLAEKRLALDALNIAVTWHPDKHLDIQGSMPVAIETDARG
jgi:Resolvase, N terminal domain